LVKHMLCLSISGFVAALGLLIGTSLLPASAPAGAASALAPDLQPAPIQRSTMLEDTIELPSGVYRLVLAELRFEPGSDTGVHVHPGPSVGFIQDGRITVSLASGGETNTYSGGSAVRHPWNEPHAFRNQTDQNVTMLSFELIPVEQ
jgi:quercetin dioxygenase-like cupin family protein